MSCPEHYDWEPPDVPRDESVTYRCQACDEEWAPEIEYEYQGAYPHGGTVAFFADEADLCPVCLLPGEEVG